MIQQTFSIAYQIASRLNPSIIWKVPSYFSSHISGSIEVSEILPINKRQVAKSFLKYER